MIKNYDELKRRAKEELGAVITDIHYKDPVNLKDQKYFYLPNGTRATVKHMYKSFLRGDRWDLGWRMVAQDEHRKPCGVCGKHCLYGVGLDEIWEGLKWLSEK